MNLNDFLIDLGGAMLYGLVGLVLLSVGYLVIDLLTPGKLGHALMVRTHVNGAIVAACAMLAVGTIVTVSIWSADGKLGEGLAESAGYGLVGIVLLAIAYRLIDLATPGHLGETIMEDGFHPVSLLIGASLLAVGAIVAASLS